MNGKEEGIQKKFGLAKDLVPESVEPMYKLIPGCALIHLPELLELNLPDHPNYHLKQIIVKVDENEDLPEEHREANPGSHWFGYPLLEHNRMLPIGNNITPSIDMNDRHRRRIEGLREELSKFYAVPPEDFDTALKTVSNRI